MDEKYHNLKADEEFAKKISQMNDGKNINNDDDEELARRLQDELYATQ